MGREFEEQAEHDRMVTLLHRKLYRHPNARNRNFQSFTNHPIKTHALRDGCGEKCYPDIVVFWPRHQRPVTVVEVETASTVTPEEAKEWRQFSQLPGDFHLYVPRGLGAMALELARGLDVTELHEYWTRDGKHFQRRLA